MKILNLFSGIGGNRTLWGNSHQITAVESNQQIAYIYGKRFPKDIVIITDAYEYLLWNYDTFDFIWASPPCQTHSCANNWLHAQGCRRYPDMRLWQLIIFLQKFCEYGDNAIKWVVENVKPYYDPLIPPSFVLDRHYFWSNIKVRPEQFDKKLSIIKGSDDKFNYQNYIQELCDFHLVDKELIDFLKDKRWKTHDLKGQVLRNCVHPDVGKYILDAIQEKKKMGIDTFLTFK